MRSKSLQAGQEWPHVGLWILLIALPFAVLIIGSATLVRSWNEGAQLRREIRAHLATLCVAAATVTAAAVLAIVALHMLTD